MTLRAKIAELAEVFMNDVLAALHSASLSELAGNSSPAVRSRVKAPIPRSRRTAKGSGRLKRSSADIQHVVDSMVALLQKHPDGLRADQIRASLGLLQKEVTRPISLALETKAIRRKGIKRATTYFA